MLLILMSLDFSFFFCKIVSGKLCFYHDSQRFSALLILPASVNHSYFYFSKNGNCLSCLVFSSFSSKDGCFLHICVNFITWILFVQLFSWAFGLKFTITRYIPKGVNIFLLTICISYAYAQIRMKGKKIIMRFCFLQHAISFVISKMMAFALIYGNLGEEEMNSIG